MRPIFHLSLSVGDLAKTEAFYISALDARVGRRTDHWIDLWVFGAQLTAYARPKAVIPQPWRDTQHFGATLAWDDWRALAARLQAQDVAFRLAPTVDEALGVAKMMLVDPDGYLVEIKAYRDPAILGGAMEAS